MHTLFIDRKIIIGDINHQSFFIVLISIFTYSTLSIELMPELIRPDWF